MLEYQCTCGLTHNVSIDTAGVVYYKSYGSCGGQPVKDTVTKTGTFSACKGACDEDCFDTCSECICETCRTATETEEVDLESVFHRPEEAECCFCCQKIPAEKESRHWEECEDHPAHKRINYLEERFYDLTNALEDFRSELDMRKTDIVSAMDDLDTDLSDIDTELD